MIPARKFDKYDPSKAGKIKCWTAKFMNPYESDEYLIYECDYVPVCNEHTRKDLRFRFIDCPLIDDLWKAIDFNYSSIYESLCYDFYKKLMVIPNSNKLVNQTIKSLEAKISYEKNIDFYENFVSFIYVSRFSFSKIIHE